MRAKGLLAKTIVTMALSICMAAGCIVTTEAAPYTEPCGVDVRNNGDGTLDVILRGDDDNTNLTMFDYGLVYDNTKLSMENIAWTEEFESAYTKGDRGILAQADLDTYVVAGGVHVDNEYIVTKEQNFLVVTFKVLDGKNAGEILLTDDSAQYDKDFTNATGVILTLPGYGLSKVLTYNAGAIVSSEELVQSPVAGDANGDGKVDLTDAQMVLKAALKINTMDVKSATDVDVNDDSKVDLTDAQWVLKAALKISTFDEMKMQSK